MVVNSACEVMVGLVGIELPLAAATDSRPPAGPPISILWVRGRFGCSFSILGTVTVSTPLSTLALICSRFASSGSLKERMKLDLVRSTQCQVSLSFTSSLLRSPLIRRVRLSCISTLISSLFKPVSCTWAYIWKLASNLCEVNMKNS